MIYNLMVLARDAVSEARWKRDLQFALKDLVEIKFSEDGQVLFVDAAMEELEQVLEKIDRRGKAVFLLLDANTANAKVPSELLDGRVDDVLLYPFRPLEVLSKLRHYQQLLMWDEVSRMNASFSELIAQLHEDVRLAERMQKSRVPVRFPDTKGFKVTSRYLAGMKSGGDHFDLAESKDGNLISIVLSDSSSYGLSSAVLSVLMRVAMKLSSDESRSSVETVRKIQEELKMTLGEKDKLSLFYGVISRKDYKLRYLNLGTTCAFYAGSKEGFHALPTQGEPMTQKSGAISVQEVSLGLEPEGRLVLLSDGFVDVMGGVQATEALLNQFRKKEALDLINELVFRVKAGFSEPDDMPAQDSTAAVFDIDSRVIRLAR